MASLRVLSLDGGGSWALIQVKALIDLFSAKEDGTDVTGHDVLKNFDLVVGNSGGTLVLGGLIKDLPLAQILAFFMDEKKRRQIFVEASFFQDPVAHLMRPFGIGPKYDTRAKLKGLKALLGTEGEMAVGDVPAAVGDNYRGVKPHVVFCAFDYDRRREDFMRSDSGSLTGSGRARPEITVALAVHASSNAPLNYFDAPALTPNARYWDGAVGGYNNPVLAGVIEGVANAGRYNVADKDIVALSIGTGNVALPLQKHVPHEDPNLVQPLQNPTIVNDLNEMATSVLDDPPDAASFIAHVVLGCRLPTPGGAPVTDGRIVRMNPLVQPLKGDDTIPWQLPPGLKADEFHALVKLDMDAVAQNDVKLIAKFCDLWLKDKLANQPIRANRDTLGAEIGHGRYSVARAAWETLAGPEHGGVPIA